MYQRWQDKGQKKGQLQKVSKFFFAGNGIHGSILHQAMRLCQQQGMATNGKWGRMGTWGMCDGDLSIE